MELEAQLHAQDQYSGYESWKGWERLFEFTADQARAFVGETRGLAIRDADVFEIGFGSGAFLAWARSVGARVAGSEIIPALVERAQIAGLEVLAPDLEKWTNEHRERFDTVAAFDVFEHLTQRQIVAHLHAAEQILKPGGVLLLRFPNAQSPFGLAPQFGDPTHLTPLSRGVIERLSSGTGLVIERYANAFRVRGTGPRGLVRGIRYLVRDMLTAVLGWAYAAHIPWDPAVVITLRKPRSA